MRGRKRWLLALPLLLLVIVWLAPALASGLLARSVERTFAEEREGRLTIGALDLGWFGAQRARGVQLIDPDGAVVVEASVELPPLFELARGAGRELGTLSVTARADLVEDEAGVTNLERALRARAEAAEGEEPAGEEPGEPDEEGAGAGLPAADLRIALEEITWSDARTRRAGAPLVFRDLDVRVTTAADGGLEVRAEGLPTGLADAMLEQEGLLVDVLGPTAELELRGGFPLETRPLALELRSHGAALSFTGTLADGVLVAGEGDALDATVPLNPLFTERVVGPLVPVLFGLSKPEGAEPVGLHVTGFRLPLDGDLSALDADLVLELGEVAYQMAPGLQDVLAQLDQATELRFSELEPLHVQVRSGVARYERLAVEVLDHELVFDGSYDLSSSELGLATGIPLKIFGTKVARVLDEAREYIDPETIVPVQVSGPWRRPKVRVEGDFLKDLAKDAAESALRDKLRDLLKDR